MERVVAVDIDLRQFAAWDDTTGEFIAEEPSKYECILWLAIHTNVKDTLLIECASPHLYAPKGKVFKKQQAWCIFNSMMVSRLNYLFQDRKVLVSPSSTWTKSLSEPIRHKLAGVIEPKFPRAKGRHDLKECQAMIWTYRNEPDLWQPLESYLESL